MIRPIIYFIAMGFVFGLLIWYIWYIQTERFLEDDKNIKKNKI